VPPIVLPSEPLTDGVVALRPWRQSDLPKMVRICQDPEVPRWTAVPANYRETDARVWFSRIHDLHRAGAGASLAITADDALLGSISLLRIHWEHARAEVGYLVAAEARSKGIATRAVRLICAWGFEALELERIELLAATGNIASQRVAERAGFTREAVLRSYQSLKGERLDLIAYGLLAGSG
jgi:RimJ/RimL family protein N-acetyltransferase